MNSCIAATALNQTPIDTKSNAPPSFSAMYALEDGYNMVLYSMTHRLCPTKILIHECMGVRIILKCGMCLVWNGSLVHSGAKSRKNSEGKHLDDMRLFVYLWATSNHGLRSQGPRDDSNQLHRKATKLCEHFDRNNFKCNKCCGNDQCIIEISDLNMDDYECGDIILGDINDVGWIVVKGNPLKAKARDNINLIADTGECFFIEKGTYRFQKFNSSFDKNVFMLTANAHTKRFFSSLKTTILDQHLPTTNYIFGKVNLLKMRR